MPLRIRGERHVIFRREETEVDEVSDYVLSFLFPLSLSLITLTFIISTIVLRAIMARTVYSKEGDTTKCHRRYWNVCRFWGM